MATTRCLRWRFVTPDNYKRQTRPNLLRVGNEAFKITCKLKQEIAELQEYRRRERTHVTAVRLDLDTDGFTYHKWGSAQRCKRGDWLVNNQGDVYTIDAETF